MTQRHTGRHVLIERLADQVGSREKALAILQKRGHVDSHGNLTEAGKKRDAMTARERAVDRASKTYKKPKSHFKYDPRTNRAKLK